MNLFHKYAILAPFRRSIRRSGTTLPCRLRSSRRHRHLIATRTWNQNYWPLSIKTGPTSSSSTIQNLSLGYDYAGNINALTDTLTPSRTQSFTLDALNRIGQATGTYGTVTYTYDDNGNRKSRVTGGVTQTYTSSTSSNRLSKVADGTTTRNFSYTAKGDLSSDDRAASPDLAFTYTRRGRMSQLKTSGTTTATYKTDAWGERASKTLASGPITHYLYDTQGHLLEEADGSTGAVIRDTIWLPDSVGPDLPIGQADASGTITYLHNDQLGTPQKITDATQAVVWDRTQQPFGEDAAVTGSVPTSLRFPGQTYDAENALHYNLMRDYDPSTGRYVEYDPIGLDGGWNPYAYAEGNPLVYIDKDGRISVAGVGRGFGAVVTGVGEGAAEGAEAGPYGAAAGALIGGGFAAYDLYNALHNDPADDARSGAEGSCPVPGKGSEPSEEDRCRKVKDQCIEECSTTPPLGQAGISGRTNQGMPFYNCYNKCMRENRC